MAIHRQHSHILLGFDTRRLYVLTPTVMSAKKIVETCLLNHIEERHIHIVAKDHAILAEADLPEADLFQESDLIPSMGRGLVFGGCIGMVAGVIAHFMGFGGAAPLAVILFGVFFGILMSSMIGISVPNSQLKAYKSAIDNGELLLIMDMPKERVAVIREIIASQHTEAKDVGLEPMVPAFP